MQATQANQPSLVLGTSLSSPTPSWTLGFLAQSRSFYFPDQTVGVVWAAFNSLTVCQPNGLLYTVVGPITAASGAPSLRLNNRAIDSGDFLYGSTASWQNNQAGFDIASCTRNGWVHVAGATSLGAQPWGAIGIGNDIDLYGRAFDGCEAERDERPAVKAAAAGSRFLWWICNRLPPPQNTLGFCPHYSSRYISELVLYSGTSLSSADAAALWTYRIGASVPDTAFTAVSTTWSASGGALPTAAPALSGSASAASGFLSVPSTSAAACATYVPLSAGDTTVSIWIKIASAQVGSTGNMNLWNLGLGSSSCSPGFLNPPYTYFSGALVGGDLSRLGWHFFPDSWWFGATPSALPADSWIHLTVSVPRTAGTATTYVNGAAVSTLTAAFNPGTATFATLWLGYICCWGGWVGFTGCAARTPTDPPTHRGVDPHRFNASMLR